MRVCGGQASRVAPVGARVSGAGPVGAIDANNIEVVAEIEFSCLQPSL